ncbi:MAG: DUF2185 domain-containing protein [Firmicutes bacterium]|nr:DUF2185 domain-containing protein [Bacillota bacterium]
MEKFGFVTATKMLVDEKRKVHFMYREESQNPQSSGWNFFCGEETPEYMDNPDNIAIYDINTILEVDKSIAPYLSATYGMAFERKHENAPFTVVEDFLEEVEK